MEGVMASLLMEELLVGHEDLDADHEVLVRGFNDLGRAVRAGDSPRAAAALARTWDDVVAHFATEEALMDTLQYPERVAHRAAHQLFLEDLRALVREHAANGLGEEVSAWAVQRLPEWLAFHIQTNDAPLARFAARVAARELVRNAMGEPTPERKRQES